MAAISLVSLTRKPATPRDAPRTQQLSRQSNSKWLHSNALRRRQLANYLIKYVLASRFLLFLSWPHDAPIAQFSFPSAASHNLTSSPDVIYSPVNGKKLHIIKIFTLQATDGAGKSECIFIFGEADCKCATCNFIREKISCHVNRFNFSSDDGFRIFSIVPAVQLCHFFGYREPFDLFTTKGWRRKQKGKDFTVSFKITYVRTAWSVAIIAAFA